MNEVDQRGRAFEPAVRQAMVSVNTTCMVDIVDRTIDSVGVLLTG